MRGADAHLLAPDGVETVRKMLSLSEAQDKQLRFSATLPPAGQDFRYRVRAGDALTRYYYVTVAAPPAVTGIDIRYDYPAYTHRKPLEQANAAGDISAVTGTHVTVTAHVDKRVEAGSLYLGRQRRRPPHRRPQAGPRRRDDVCTFGFDLTPGLKGYWHITVSDRYAFTNPERDYSIEAVPDMPPTLLIAHPRTRLNRLKPTDSLPVIFAAQDDLGLASLDVLLKKDGQDVAPISIASHARRAGRHSEHGRPDRRRAWPRPSSRAPPRWSSACAPATTCLPSWAARTRRSRTPTPSTWTGRRRPMPTSCAPRWRRTSAPASRRRSRSFRTRRPSRAPSATSCRRPAPSPSPSARR